MTDKVADDWVTSTCDRADRAESVLREIAEFACGEHCTDLAGRILGDYCAACYARAYLEKEKL